MFVFLKSVAECTTVRGPGCDWALSLQHGNERAGIKRVYARQDAIVLVAQDVMGASDCERKREHHCVLAAAAAFARLVGPSKVHLVLGPVRRHRLALHAVLDLRRLHGGAGPLGARACASAVRSCEQPLQVAAGTSRGPAARSVHARTMVRNAVSTLFAVLDEASRKGMRFLSANSLATSKRTCRASPIARSDLLPTSSLDTFSRAYLLISTSHCAARASARRVCGSAQRASGRAVRRPRIRARTSFTLLKECWLVTS